MLTANTSYATDSDNEASQGEIEKALPIPISLQKLTSQANFLFRVLTQLRSEHQQHFESCSLLKASQETHSAADAIERSCPDPLTMETENAFVEETVSDAEEIQVLKAQLAVIREENIHLQTKIQHLEEMKVVFQPLDKGIELDDNIKAIEANCSGENTMEEIVIEGHNHCNRKCNELWQTIKTLQLYVDTFRAERDELVRQRDEAIVSAESAWAANVRLAGNGNPHQKIKYLQTLKEENTKLREKARKLQLRLSAREARSCSKCINNRSASNDNNSKSPLHSVLPDAVSQNSSQESSMGKLEAERNELYRKMWSRNKKLQSEIDRLKAQRKLLQNGKA